MVACALASAVTVQAQVNLPFLDTPDLGARVCDRHSAQQLCCSCFTQL